MGLILNGQPLRENASGVHTYVSRLVDEFSRQKDVAVVLVIDGNPLPISEFASARASVPAIARPERPEFYQNLRNVVPLPAKKAARDMLSHYRRYPYRHWLYHEPNHVFTRHRGPKVLTVHDLSCLTFPEFHPPDRVELFRRYLPESIRSADHIITPSVAVKQELVQRFGISTEQVSAVHLGVDQMALANLENVKNITKPYILIVGAIEPRKNTGLTLEAFSQLPLSLSREWCIVHAGPAGWRNESLGPRISNLQEQGRWIELGMVSPSQLASLYSSAGFLAYPSVYEGFGLPPLEAMAQGCPVIVSDLPVFREVCAEAAMYFDANSAEHLANVMQKLMESSAVREEQVLKGASHWQKFKWAETARQTLEIYRAVAPDALEL